MKQLAICIPTYNQPGMMEEMFIRCIDVYSAAGIDIFIYDSSPGRETESMVCRYQAEHENIYYRHLPADIHSNRKVLEAYQEIIGMKRYAYLWLCPDYIQLTKQGTECVLRHCGEGFDICVLNYRDVEHIGEKSYTDMNAFFLDCAWHMSSYMAAIIYLPSFEEVQWERFYERYTVPGRISHSHVALYFEQLAKLPKAKAVHIPVSSLELRVSPYREASMWKKEIFTIWCEDWPDMIYALPDCYRYKDEVVKKLGVNTGILGRDNFVGMRRERIYDISIYHKYQQKWKKLTNVSRVFLWMLAVMPVKIVGLFEGQKLRHNVMNKRLRRFGAKHPDIFIYGCGFMAKRTSAALDRLHVQYRGYVVSDCSNEKQSFNGLPVIECENLPRSSPGMGIIMALSKENTFQVMEEKQELGRYAIFYMYQYEDVLE